MDVDDILPQKPKFSALTAVTAVGQKVEFRRVRARLRLQMLCSSSAVFRAAIASTSLLPGALVPRWLVRLVLRGMSQLCRYPCLKTG